jgi:hypothetical protein
MRLKISRKVERRAEDVIFCAIVTDAAVKASDHIRINLEPVHPSRASANGVQLAKDPATITTHITKPPVFIISKIDCEMLIGGTM